MKFEGVTQKIIGCAYKVYRVMGFGFVESVYEKCLMIELQKAGIRAEAQKNIFVYYDDQVVGEYKADIFVNDAIIVELKSVNQLVKAHEVQLVNYLTATRKDIGLVVNFGPKSVEVKRKVRDLNEFQDISCKSC